MVCSEVDAEEDDVVSSRLSNKALPSATPGLDHDQAEAIVPSSKKVHTMLKTDLIVSIFHSE